MLSLKSGERLIQKPVLKNIFFKTSNIFIIIY